MERNIKRFYSKILFPAPTHCRQSVLGLASALEHPFAQLSKCSFPLVPQALVTLHWAFPLGVSRLAFKMPLDLEQPPW